MEGGPVSSGSKEDHQGMIPRAVTQIFATSNSLTDKGWQVSISKLYLFYLMAEEKYLVGLAWQIWLFTLNREKELSTGWNTEIC